MDDVWHMGGFLVCAEYAKQVGMIAMAFEQDRREMVNSGQPLMIGAFLRCQLTEQVFQSSSLVVL